MTKRNLELHHAGILTADMEGSITFYREMLGLQVIARFSQAGLFDTCFLGDGSPSTRFFVRLTGPPFRGELGTGFKEHGPMIHTLAFRTDDVEAWYQVLLDCGAAIISPPEPFLTTRAFSFRDPAGVRVEILEFCDPALALQEQASERSDGEIDYRFSHLCLTCFDVASLERFYVEELGLRRLAAIPEEGIAFLCDPVSWRDPEQRVVPLEIFGPPGLWAPDEAFLQRHGPNLQYLCFSVADVDAAYRELVAKGAAFHLEPTDTGSNRVAFFRDPNGIDLEILRPLPEYFDREIEKSASAAGEESRHESREKRDPGLSQIQP